MWSDAPLDLAISKWLEVTGLDGAAHELLDCWGERVEGGETVGDFAARTTDAVVYVHPAPPPTLPAPPAAPPVQPRLVQQPPQQPPQQLQQQQQQLQQQQQQPLQQQQLQQPQQQEQQPQQQAQPPEEVMPSEATGSPDGRRGTKRPRSGGAAGGSGQLESPAPAARIWINLAAPDGHSWRVSVKSSQHFSKVRAVVAARADAPGGARGTVLTFRGRVLADDDTPQSAGVGDGDTVDAEFV
jgi:hypothetical protein